MNRFSGTGITRIKKGTSSASGQKRLSEKYFHLIHIPVEPAGYPGTAFLGQFDHEGGCLTGHRVFGYPYSNW